MKLKNNFATLALGLGLLIANGASAQSWSLSGNVPTETDTLGNITNQSIRFITNNQSRMFIKKTGQVGIGTSTPTEKLDVNGNIKASGTLSDAAGNSTNWNTAYGWGNHAAAGYLTAETDPQVGANTTNYVPKWNGSALVTSSIFNDNNGFVGIGTATPNSQLHLSSTTGATLTGTGAFTIGTIAGANLAMDLNKIQARYNGTGSTFYLNYYGGDVRINSGEKMTEIGSEGNVTIGGYSDPTYKCLVRGMDTSTAPVFRSQVEYTGNAHVHAIEAYSNPGNGWGYGVYSTGGYRGVYGIGSGGTSTGTCAGVQGYASGSGGVRYGIYGSASGGTDNWGGYFPTKTYTSELRVGTTNGAAGYIVAVGGKLIAEEVRVELEASWPDYVFSKDHQLMSIDDLEKSVNEYKHLPGIPSACEVEENGIMLGSMQTKMMEKIEESTLYIIQLKKENDNLKNKLDKLQSQVEILLNK